MKMVLAVLVLHNLPISMQPPCWLIMFSPNTVREFCLKGGGIPVTPE